MPIFNVIITLMVSIFGSIGNLAIIYVFSRNHSLRTVNNVFVLQLSIGDLLKAAIILPTKAVTQSEKREMISPGFCILTGCLSAVAFSHSAMLFAAIAVVRYFKIVEQSSFATAFARCRVVTYSLTLLFIALLFSALPLLGVGKYEYSLHHGVCFADWSTQNTAFRTILYILTMGTSYPVLIFCYARIFVRLRKHGRNITRSLNNGNYHNQKRENMYIKITEEKRKEKAKHKKMSNLDFNRDLLSHSREDKENVENLINSGPDTLLSLRAGNSSVGGTGIRHGFLQLFDLPRERKIIEVIRERNINPSSVPESVSRIPLNSSGPEEESRIPHNESGLKEESTITLNSSGPEQASRIPQKESSSDHFNNSLDAQSEISCQQQKFPENEDTEANDISFPISSSLKEEIEYRTEASACKRQLYREEAEILVQSKDDTGSSDQRFKSTRTGQIVRRSVRNPPCRMSGMEIQVTKLMFAAVMVFTMCWFPAFLVNILMLSKAVQASDGVLFGVITLVDFKVLLNPLIYGLGSPSFRNAFLKCLNAERGL